VESQALELRELLVSEGIISQPDLSLDEPLISSGLVASLDVVRIISRLEETYDIAIADDDLRPENFETCNQMSVMLRRYLHAQDFET
jgi:acyl carrier protein